jgi:KDO2-lipid IV(A) lauroyltransferase
MHAPAPAPPKHRPPRIRKKKPLWLQVPQSIAIRSAMSAPLIVGLPAAMRAARSIGSIVPRIMPKHFTRATVNLKEAFPTWSDEKIRHYALSSYQHLCQLGVEIAFAPRLITQEGFTRHLAFGDVTPAVRTLLTEKPVILITGHVGNWELIGYAISMIGFPMHAVYRPLDLAPMDDWLRSTRERRGLTLVSKFGAVKALPPVLKSGYPIGLVADQSGGDRGLFTPFFGRLTSSYKMIGILAMQTGATLVCGMARRLRPNEPPPTGSWIETPSKGRQLTCDLQIPSLRYSVELVDTFGPEDWSKQPDPLYYLTARYRRAIETMVRSAPEQYFWMHRIWRSRPAHERHGKPFPPMLKEKLASLPWMTPDAVEAVIERSHRDAADIQRSHAAKHH